MRGCALRDATSSGSAPGWQAFSQLFSLRQSIRFGKAAHLSGIEDREVATPEGNSISEFMQSAAFPNR